jgi:peptide chain release factor subunit 1
MPGRLPIGRVRETADAPRIHEPEKRRFAEQQAERDREGATGPAAAGATRAHTSSRRHRRTDSGGREVRDLLHSLAEVEAGDLPVLSVYLDLRPHATGGTPGQRSGTVVLKDRLRELERTFLPRGADLDSFRADAERIRRYVDETVPPAAHGLALFACDGRGLFEAVEAGVAFENTVSVGPVPDLFPLARLLDEQETTVVAVVDTNTSRLFVTRAGRLVERGGADEDSKYYRKRSMGGWSQARYQRHNAGVRAEFARETAAELERLVAAEGAVRVVLAGDEVAIPLLEQALSPSVQALVQDVRRIHIRAPLDEVHDEVAPVLAQAEADDARSTADRLVAAVRAGGLGVAGTAATRAALARGQGDELLLDPAAELDESERSALVRLATTTGAAVEIVEGHDGLRRLGGVGALLRYRLD